MVIAAQEAGLLRKYVRNLKMSVNLFSCIETGFAPAENFKAEPYTFNRNYLAHGMTRRPVRQRDCIQLFFALYNLTVFLKFS